MVHTTGISQLFAYRKLQITFILLSLCGPTGCLSYTKERTLEQAQNHEGYAFLENIVPGQTSAEWVSDQLGHPGSVSLSTHGNELWRYVNLEAVQTRVGVIPLIDVRMRSQETSQFWFEIENDVVIRYWHTSE